MSKTYTTIQGDMWDGIAYKQLGDVKYTDLLMNANTQYRKVYIFSAGVELVIPDIEGQRLNFNTIPVSINSVIENSIMLVKNDSQKEFLVEKNVGDIITIKGQVKSIGEVMGYSIDIKEVQ